MWVRINGVKCEVEFKYQDRSIAASIMREVVLQHPNDPGTVHMATGVATCAVTDQFVKAKGRKVALARALKKLKLPYEERCQFWAQVFDPLKGMKKE